MGAFWACGGVLGVGAGVAIGAGGVERAGDGVGGKEATGVCEESHASGDKGVAELFCEEKYWVCCSGVSTAI